MRGAIYADWEIRYLALEVLDLLQKEAPLLFGDFEISALPDGTRIAVPEYSKV
jgi:thymidylate synthase (FAD)